jgi:hypothetical protein
MAQISCPIYFPIYFINIIVLTGAIVETFAVDDDDDVLQSGPGRRQLNQKRVTINNLRQSTQLRRQNILRTATSTQSPVARLAMKNSLKQQHQQQLTTISKNAKMNLTLTPKVKTNNSNNSNAKSLRLVDYGAFVF